jgi:hypothetical protein
MKSYLFLVLALCSMACSKSDNDDDSSRYATTNNGVVDGYLNGSNLQFSGSSVATNTDAGAYTDAEACFEVNGDKLVLNLYMHQTRFAAAMPALEMRVSNLSYTPGTGAALSFDIDSIVPEVLLPDTEGGYSYQPLPSYTLTALKGTLSGTQLCVSFSCDVPRLGNYQVSYRGALLKAE